MFGKRLTKISLYSSPASFPLGQVTRWSLFARILVPCLGVIVCSYCLGVIVCSFTVLLFKGRYSVTFTDASFVFFIETYILYQFRGYFSVIYTRAGFLGICEPYTDPMLMGHFWVCVLIPC